MPFERVVVVGAGAIGSLYAARLSTRARVHVVARPAHAEAIARHGLQVSGVEAMTAHVSASTTVDPIGPRALLLLTTKVNDNRTAIEALAGGLEDDTIILCVQNGLGGEEIVREVLSAHRRTNVVLRA